MNRRALLDEADAIQRAGFTDDNRARFDEIIRQVEAMDATTPTPASTTRLPPIDDSLVETPSAPPAPRARTGDTSLSGRRRLLGEQIDGMEAAGYYPRSGVIVSGSSYTAPALRRFLESAPFGFLDDIQRQLNAAEDRGYEIARADAERLARFESAQLTAFEQQQRDELLAEAQQAAARADTVEGRLERVETVLERIAASLERRS